MRCTFTPAQLKVFLRENQKKKELGSNGEDKLIVRKFRKESIKKHSTFEAKKFRVAFFFLVSQDNGLIEACAFATKNENTHKSIVLFHCESIVLLTVQLLSWIECRKRRKISVQKTNTRKNAPFLRKNQPKPALTHISHEMLVYIENDSALKGRQTT